MVRHTEHQVLLDQRLQCVEHAVRKRAPASLALNPESQFSLGVVDQSQHSCATNWIWCGTDGVHNEGLEDWNPTIHLSILWAMDPTPDISNEHQQAAYDIAYNAAEEVADGKLSSADDDIAALGVTMDDIVRVIPSRGKPTNPLDSFAQRVFAEDANHFPKPLLSHDRPRVVEAPAVFDRSGLSIFLAGGITGCPDWQADLVGLLGPQLEHRATLLNPRRSSFDASQPGVAREQIEWEFHHLRWADVILFWFPKETLCPISLYELGAWSMTGKPLFVGVHPDYARKLDIEIQTQLERPEIRLACSLAELASQVVTAYELRHWG